MNASAWLSSGWRRKAITGSALRRRISATASLTPPAALEDIPEEGWRATVDANLLATFLTLKSFLPGMKARGRGAIITVASSAGRRADARAPIPYGADPARPADRDGRLPPAQAARPP
jgi:NAD(P)-dependent dehydrogenase (short-subunit alcohol dehydrogenase family)